MNGVRWTVYGLLFFLFTVNGTPFTAPVFAASTSTLAADLPNAMWVWDARIAMHPESRARLFKFCKRHQVSSLFLSAYNLQSPLDKAYRDFNRQAHEAGLTVFALAGDPRWGKPRYHSVPLQWVESIRQMNASAPAQERFDGLHTDIEVYLLSKTWEEHPAELLGGYLDLHEKIMKVIRDDPQRMTCGVDVPFWFDDDANYRIEWHGAVKAPSHHILDICDSITVMAYRNFAEGPDGTIHLVTLELNYADEIGKKVLIGQETQEELYPPYVTFGGTSYAQFKRELNKVFQAVSRHKSFGGFAIHHYESYKKLVGES